MDSPVEFFEAKLRSIPLLDLLDRGPEGFPDRLR